MPKVEFLFDEGKDIWNIYRTCKSPIGFGYDFSSSIDKSLLKILKDKSIGECKNELEEYNKELYNPYKMKKLTKIFKNAWRKVELKFFKRLEEITKRKFTGDIKCYLTTICRCPYNPDKNWFMVFFSNNAEGIIKTCCHEILHLHFHKFYFNKLKKEVGEKEAHNIKEAMTVLLNIEFKDLISGEDGGYPMHEELRNFIKKEWLEEKDFDELTKKCVKFVRQSPLKD